MVGAVDVAGTKIAVGIVDKLDRVVAHVECPTEAEQGYKKVLARIKRSFRQLMQETSAKIVGIGIGSTGPINPFTGEIGDVDFFPTWRGENPVRDLTELFQVSVAMENDADDAALAEAGGGAGKNKARLVYVTVGTGFGSGIVLDGHVYGGVDRSHPEIGHHVIDPSGPPCVGGFRGCWESLAAGPAMMTWRASRAALDYAHCENLTAKRICELAFEGDRLACRAVERQTYYLGRGLANLVTLFSPDAIILGGTVMKCADLFLNGIRKTIRESCRFIPFEKTELALASLGEDANLMGAARAWHHPFVPERGKHG